MALRARLPAAARSAQPLVCIGLRPVMRGALKPPSRVVIQAARTEPSQPSVQARELTAECMVAAALAASLVNPASSAGATDLLMQVANADQLPGDGTDLLLDSSISFSDLISTSATFTLSDHLQQWTHQAAAKPMSATPTPVSLTVSTQHAPANNEGLSETAKQLLVKAGHQVPSLSNAPASAASGPVRSDLTSNPLAHALQGLGNTPEPANEASAQIHASLPFNQLAQELHDALKSTTDAASGFRQTTDELIRSMVADWQLPVPIAQVPAYAATAVGVAVLLWGAGLEYGRGSTASQAAAPGSAARARTPGAAAQPAAAAQQQPVNKANPWGAAMSSPDQGGSTSRAMSPAPIQSWGTAPSSRGSSSASAPGPKGGSGARGGDISMRSLSPGPGVARGTTPAPSASRRGQAGTQTAGFWGTLRAALAPGGADGVPTTEASKAEEASRRAERRLRAEQRVAVKRAALADLKAKLGLVALALGPLLALMPSGADPVRDQADAMLRQLEASAHTTQLVEYDEDSDVTSVEYVTTAVEPQALLGEWVVQYATVASSTPGPAAPAAQPGTSRPLSGGTATVGAWSGAPPAAQGVPAGQVEQPKGAGGLTGYLLHLLAALPGFGLVKVHQILTPDGNQMRVTNSATFSLGPLGVWRVDVQGTWRTAGSQALATQTFETLGLQPLSVLGMDIRVPPVEVALPPQLRQTSEWLTTYIDSDTRVARGPNGTVFLLTRAVLPDTQLRPQAASPVPAWASAATPSV